MEEGLFLAPGTAGRSDLITQGRPAAMGESRRDVPLGRAVVVHIDVRAIFRSPEETLGLRVVQRRFRLRRRPGVAAVAAEAGIGPWRIGGETRVVVVGRAHHDLQFAGCAPGGDIALVEKDPAAFRLGDEGLEFPLQ